MASGRLFIPGWMPARDSDGAPIPNVSAFFYVNGTDILAVVYADAELSTPLTNPVSANSSGRFPQIYAETDRVFSVSVDAPYGPPGQPFTFDRISPSLAANIAAANLAQGAAEDAEQTLEDINQAIADAIAAGGDAGLAGALAGAAAAEEAIANLTVQPDGFGAAIPLRQALGNGYGNTPMLDWRGKRGAWNGTSIPHQGQPGFRYPDFVSEQLGAPIVNNAWASSSLSYRGLAGYAAQTTDAERIGYVSAASMMEDDRLAGLAFYGPTSAYDDSFNAITKASQQTSEYRYEAVYDDGPVYFHVLHDPYNENVPLGTLNPATMTVTAISLGASTTFTVNALDPELAVGSGFGVRITGIPKLQYNAGRVSAIDIGANTVTVNINSTGFTGTMTSGAANHYNRATVSGAYQWMIHRLFGKSRETDQQSQTGQTWPHLILPGDPSNWSPAVPPTFMQGTYDRTRLLQDIANKWNNPSGLRRVTFFDLATKMGISQGQHRIFMSDGTHPVDEGARRLIASFYVHWMNGGENPYRSDLDYPMRGQGEWIDGHQIEWSDLFGGAVTPEIFVGDPVSVISEDWVSAADWTANGSPSVGAAPWGGVQAARFDFTSGDVSYSRAVAGSPDAIRTTFTLYMPDTTVVTSGVWGSAPITLSNALGDWFKFGLVLTNEGVAFNGFVYGANSNTQLQILSPTGRLADGVPSVIEITQIKKTSTRNGLIQIKQDGVAILKSTATDDLAISPMNKITVGVVGSNAPSPFTMYMGPLSFGTLPVYDYLPRFTGTLTAGSDYQVVNGLITKELP